MIVWACLCLGDLSLVVVGGGGEGLDDDDDDDNWGGGACLQEWNFWLILNDLNEAKFCHKSNIGQIWRQLYTWNMVNELGKQSACPLQ